MQQKIEEILNYILVRVTAEPTLKINKKATLKNEILSICSMIHLFLKLTMFKKTIEKKSRKHAKLWNEKIENILTSILMPLTAQATLRINKKIDFANEILSIFSIIHLFFKLTMFKEKNDREKIENMLNYGAK